MFMLRSSVLLVFLIINFDCLMEWLSDTNCKVDLGLTEINSKASIDLILPQSK